MAKIIDEVLEEDTTDTMEETVETPVEAKEEVNIPEKYRNKSLEDIIAMHQEAEKLIGKQGGEVGELRKVVDDFIRTQSSTNLKTTETVEEDDADAYFTDPKSTVNKAIDNHPAIKEAKQAAMQVKREQVLSKLASEFPNFMEVVSSKPFEEWVKGSRIRTELAVRAENQFDYESARELLTTWQERQQIAQQAADTSKLDRDVQLKAASVGTNNSQESVSKKMYRRSDIIKLIQTDPDKYEALAPDIIKAYQEGRVK
jgi:predicted RNA-binding protein YlqC (UPF0109 family)